MTQNLIQIADNVWRWPHHPDPDRVEATVGIIAGKHSSILVDAGNSPSVARKILRAMDERGLSPISQVIFTHHHWDHVYGACAYKASVIAHEKCRAILESEAAMPWSPEYLRQMAKNNPKLEVSCEARVRAIKDWDDFRIVVPETVFNESLTIHHEGIRIELLYVGGEHAGDSIVVKLPQYKVMFLGDCYYPPPLHLRTPESTHSASMLAGLVDNAYDHYIEGHDEPLKRRDIIEFLDEVGYRPG
jgi:glyoxylase-like metal-dependent hydrolase (beta-lactamase superfamily II)